MSFQYWGAIRQISVYNASIIFEGEIADGRKKEIELKGKDATQSVYSRFTNFDITNQDPYEALKVGHGWSYGRVFNSKLIQQINLEGFLDFDNINFYIILNIRYTYNILRQYKQVPYTSGSFRPTFQIDWRNADRMPFLTIVAHEKNKPPQTITRNQRFEIIRNIIRGRSVIITPPRSVVLQTRRRPPGPPMPPWELFELAQNPSSIDKAIQSGIIPSKYHPSNNPDFWEDVKKMGPGEFITNNDLEDTSNSRGIIDIGVPVPPEDYPPGYIYVPPNYNFRNEPVRQFLRFKISNIPR